MPARLRLGALHWSVPLVVFAAVVYLVRIQHEMVDFDVYLTAAARVVGAEPLYREADGHYQFKYFPSFAFAVVPFTWLAREAAKVAWYGLSLLLLVLFVRSSVAALPESRRSRTFLVWMCILLMGKFFARELTLGQTNVLLGLLLVRSLIAVQADRPAVAGALVGAAVFVKPYALLLMPWLAVASGVVAVAASGVVLIVGVLLPAPVYGWNGNLALLFDWYRTVTDTTAPNLMIAENVSLATMWSKWLGAGPSAAALAWATTAVLVAAVGGCLVIRRDVKRPAYLECAFLMLLVPLLSPQGWDYVLLLGTPAVVCLVDRFSEMSKAWKTVTAVGFALMSFIIYDLVGRTLYLWSMSLATVTVAALLLAASLTHLRLRRLA